jgi:hypothetical protein
MQIIKHEQQRLAASSLSKKVDNTVKEMKARLRIITVTRESDLRESLANFGYNLGNKWCARTKFCR